MTSDQLGTTRRGVRALNALSVLVGLASLALIAAAVWLTRQRRRMVTWTGFGLVAIGLTLLALRRIAGGLVVDALVGNAGDRPVGTQVWLISTTLLRTVALGLIVYGLVVLSGVALTGRHRAAAAVRRRMAPVLRRASWTYAGLALILLVYALAGPASGGRTWVASLILLLAIIAGVETLRRQTIAEFPAPPGAPRVPAQSGPPSVPGERPR